MYFQSILNGSWIVDVAYSEYRLVGKHLYLRSRANCLIDNFGLNYNLTFETIISCSFREFWA